MMIVFCRDPLEPALPDRAFEAEVAAVERLGLPYVLVDHDALVRGDEPGRVVRRVPDRPEGALAAYRGWMVTPPQYWVPSHEIGPTSQSARGSGDDPQI